MFWYLQIMWLNLSHLSPQSQHYSPKSDLSHFSLSYFCRHCSGLLREICFLVSILNGPDPTSHLWVTQCLSLILEKIFNLRLASRSPSCFPTSSTLCQDPGIWEVFLLIFSPIILDMSLNNLVVRFQSWSFKEYEVHLHAITPRSTLNLEW